MSNSFAIVPAAGRGRRMGGAKLLLPWGQSTVIEQVLSAWQASRVTHTIVVVHPEDDALAQICRASGAQVIVPAEPPTEMKVSVRIALEHIASQHMPGADDAWLLAPADLPTLSAEVIDCLLAVHRSGQESILVPVHAGRRGHPALFRWTLSGEVARLPDDCGVDSLFTRHTVTEIEASADALAPDLDTPEDYRREKKGPSPS